VKNFFSVILCFCFIYWNWIFFFRYFWK